MTAPPIALTIAGSDPSGGAGIQADLKTFHQHRVYGASVFTLLTVQNTQRVSRVQTLAPDLVVEQLDAVLTDVRPHAMKTGALGSAALVRTVAARLREERSRGPAIPLVIDPVMVSKHGHALVEDDAVQACMEALFPLAALVTPNVPEAERLLGSVGGASLSLRSLGEIEEAALTLARRFGVPVMVKGGHLESEPGQAIDVLADARGATRFAAPRIDTRHTHGTGCTYSAAIAARLALGATLDEAISGAKAWLTRALRSAPGIGLGIGPVDHLAPIDEAPTSPV
jgi:hydroxymethylpyrimidine/phosphomethylpyrimidine kinase